MAETMHVALTEETRIHDTHLADVLASMIESAAEKLWSFEVGDTRVSIHRYEDYYFVIQRSSNYTDIDIFDNRCEMVQWIKDTYGVTVPIRR